MSAFRTCIVTLPQKCLHPTTLDFHYFTGAQMLLLLLLLKLGVMQVYIWHICRVSHQLL